MGRGMKKEGESCPEACQAICCRYVTTKIDAPRTKTDWDEIHWFLCHEHVEVFIEARKWYLLFDTPCTNLDSSSRCVVYSTRPYVCRQHSAENCEYWGEEDHDKVTLRSPEDLKKYMKRRGLRLRMAWDVPDKDAAPPSPAPATRRTRIGRSKE